MAAHKDVNLLRDVDSVHADDQGFQLVSMQVQLDSRFDSAPVGTDSGPCETCTVVIGPGIYLSNLSSSDLHAAHGSPSVLAGHVCVPRGQSRPLPWKWQNSQDSGPLIALGLSCQSCAQAAASLHESADQQGSAATAAAASARLQPPGRTSPTAKQGAVPGQGKAAAASLAESFVSFLKAQDGKASSTTVDLNEPARRPSIGAGVIDIKQHQGKRTPIVLQDSKCQVRFSVRAILPATAVLYPSRLSLGGDDQ